MRQTPLSGRKDWINLRLWCCLAPTWVSPPATTSPQCWGRVRGFSATPTTDHTKWTAESEAETSLLD